MDRSARASSAYVPHRRLSRYLAALSSLVPLGAHEPPGPELPLDRAGLLSGASLGWLGPQLRPRARQAPPRLPRREACAANGPRLEGLLQAQFVERGQAGASVPRLAWRFARTRLLAAGLLALLGRLLELSAPLVLARLLAASGEGPLPVLGQTALLGLGLLLPAQFLLAWAEALNLSTACRLRSACLALGYKRLLRSKLAAGRPQQVSCHLAPDCALLCDLLGLGPQLLAGGLGILLAASLAWHGLGAWALAAPLLMLLLCCSLLAAAYSLGSSFAGKAIEFSFRRCSLLQQFLGNAHLAKICRWEQHFQQRIKDFRKRELVEMQFGGLVEGCGLALLHVVPLLSALVLALLSLHFDRELPLERYTPLLLLLLFNLKQYILSSWLALGSLSRGLAFLRKLKEILVLPEAARHPEQPADERLSVSIRGGRFSWTNPSQPVLPELDLQLPRDGLVGVCGPERSGKSSLLLAVLGQLRLDAGHLAAESSRAYVPSSPWLLEGASLRDNVLLGSAFDAGRYYRALRAARLHAELAALPELDGAGLRAAALPAPLRQKIGLARALYAGRELTLLDEPLAALGRRERLEVFERGVLGQLAGRSVLLASGRPELLLCCQRVLVLRDGRVAESGSPEELLRRGGWFARLVELGGTGASAGGSYCPWVPRDAVPKKATGAEGRSTPLTTCTLMVGVLAVARGCLLGGGPVVLLAGDLGAPSAATAALVFVGVLALLGLGLAIVCNRRLFAAARKLHDRWIDELTRGRICGFDSSAISALLSGFGSTLQQIDTRLPRSAMPVLLNAGISCMSIIVLGVLSAWLLLPALAFVVVAVTLSLYVRGALRRFQLLKMKSATRMLALVENTVEGRATIQAFSKEKEFAEKCYELFDENTTYDLMVQATRLWLEFRLKMLSVLVISATIFMSELLLGELDKLSRMSLAFVSSVQLTLSLLEAVVAVNDIHTGLVALDTVDRCVESIPKEREGNETVSSTWPTDGSLEFRNVLLFDKEESSRKALSFRIASGDKIAVVSSQADVKTAFVSALFRFEEWSSGEIFIADTATSQLPLDVLRRCICFVPGNPMLFNGTIRYNLDPSEKMTDQSLMMVLQRVYLWEKVSRLPDKLVSDSCHLFTTFEKVLIFLARALLNERTKIIIIEEPAATNITDDNRGDLLDVVLRDSFADYTVLRLSSHKIHSYQQYLTLDDDMEDYNSDQDSSTLSQLTTTTEVYTALPVNIISDNIEHV